MFISGSKSLPRISNKSTVIPTKKSLIGTE